MGVQNGWNRVDYINFKNNINTVYTEIKNKGYQYYQSIMKNNIKETNDSDNKQVNNQDYTQLDSPLEKSRMVWNIVKNYRKTNMTLTP